jgi:striatin 1/3/4
MLAAAHDHGLVTFLDLNSGQVAGKIDRAHAGGASTLLVEPQSGGLHVVTGGHDGAVKVWDIRNYQCIAETAVKGQHLRKFDEGVLCLGAHPEAPFVASGGADCLVNMYEMSYV